VLVGVRFYGLRESGYLGRGFMVGGGKMGKFNGHIIEFRGPERDADEERSFVGPRDG